MLDTARHNAQVDAVFARAPVIPVITLPRLEDALPLGRALVENGLPVLEVTLRTACALDAILDGCIYLVLYGAITCPAGCHDRLLACMSIGKE